MTPFYPDADDSVFDFPVLRYPSIDMTKLVGYRAGLPFSAELMDSLEKRSFDIIHSHCPITSTLLARARAIGYTCRSFSHTIRSLT